MIKGGQEILTLRQKMLMWEREVWEQMQTDYSHDKNFYKYCDWKMNLLDEEAEQIRYVLEMGCCE